MYIYKLTFVETLTKEETSESLDPKEGTDLKQTGVSNRKFREFICGEEALRISPAEPYCVCRPIRRGHLNISQHYPMQQVHVTSKAKHIVSLYRTIITTSVCCITIIICFEFP
jgi:hypothetical protein